MLRRRVSATDIEDITQTALCEALESERLPEEPDELRRFVLGIAHHKAADLHRRAYRSPIAQGVVANDPVAPSLGSQVEARALLGRIANAVENDHREREAFEWIVREHEGEQLTEIAATENIEAPTVRQRVSRLRRILRARWASALLIFVACGALAERAAKESSEAILTDPSLDPAGHALGSVQGKWRFLELTRADGSNAELEPRAMTMRITGRHVDVSGPLGHVGSLSRTLTTLEPRADGTFSFALVDEHGAIQRGVARLHGRFLDLELPGQGTARATRD